MKIVYRISNNSNNRDRIATKEECLRNFLATWFSGAHDSGACSDSMIILMDKVDYFTEGMIHSIIKPWQEAGTDIRAQHIASGGSSEKAFRSALLFAIVGPEDGQVYIMEDDYLHLPMARTVLLEGLSIADYVTLYDHPDKYMQGRQEFTMIRLTPSSHWKYVSSTTGTFASTVGVLKRDFIIWKYYTDGTHGVAWDYAAFSCLIGEKNHNLVSPIPGLATHCDGAWVAPLVDWSVVR